MKIVTVTPYLVGPKPSSDGWSAGQIVIFVKLETDSGLIGWGEAYALEHRQRAISEIILALGAALKGMSEATPRAFLHRIAKPMASKHPGIDYASAVSAIEIALWDLPWEIVGPARACAAWWRNRRQGAGLRQRLGPAGSNGRGRRRTVRHDARAGLRRRQDLSVAPVDPGRGRGVCATDPRSGRPGRRHLARFLRSDGPAARASRGTPVRALQSLLD